MISWVRVLNSSIYFLEKNEKYFWKKKWKPRMERERIGRKEKNEKKEKYDAMGKEEIKKYRKDRERMRWEREKKRKKK